MNVRQHIDVSLWKDKCNDKFCFNILYNHDLPVVLMADDSGHEPCKQIIVNLTY
jgi:hypothetical protein